MWASGVLQRQTGPEILIYDTDTTFTVFKSIPRLIPILGKEAFWERGNFVCVLEEETKNYHQFSLQSYRVLMVDREFPRAESVQIPHHYPLWLQSVSATSAFVDSKMWDAIVQLIRFILNGRDSDQHSLQQQTQWPTFLFTSLLKGEKFHVSNLPWALELFQSYS